MSSSAEEECAEKVLWHLPCVLASSFLPVPCVRGEQRLGSYGPSDGEGAARPRSTCTLLLSRLLLGCLVGHPARHPPAKLQRQWPVVKTSSTEGLVCWKPGDRRQHDAIRSRTAAASWICLDMGAMSWDGKGTHHQQVATQPPETHRIPAHVSHNRPHRTGTACPSGIPVHERAVACTGACLPSQQRHRQCSIAPTASPGARLCFPIPIYFPHTRGADAPPSARPHGAEVPILTQSGARLFSCFAHLAAQVSSTTPSSSAVTPERTTLRSHFRAIASQHLIQSPADRSNESAAAVAAAVARRWESPRQPTASVATRPTSVARAGAQLGHLGRQRLQYVCLEVAYSEA
ncbi:hypothetical protein CSHISOI_01950 [Colletotrichum shisoi]|uniref:Uncharacterized protein n=1 Tax=Colletotrichum shisoi TaxID=2078593 RepID=A0A5Q4C4B4_9PEZI|nr:hypothetical protein CSHISOI_01950 [Colletotrichum shisoi]